MKMARKFTLPQFGVYASTAKAESWALSGKLGQLLGDMNVDIMHSPDMHYLVTNGGFYSSNLISGKGQIDMEKETFRWEIILARQFDELGFDPKVIGLNDINLKMESIKENGLP